MMTPHQPRQLQKAYTAGRTAALREGFVPGREQCAEVEDKLNKLLAVSVAMFVTAVAAVIGVGIWLF